MKDDFTGKSLDGPSPFAASRPVPRVAVYLARVFCFAVGGFDLLRENTRVIKVHLSRC